MPINSWDPVTGNYYDASGNQVSEDQFYLQQGQAAGTAMGAIPFTDAENAAMAAGKMPTSPKDGYGYYNAGPGGAMWAPIGDARFMPAPNHDNGFAQNMQDFFNPRKNEGFIPIYTAATAGLASGAFAGADAAAGSSAATDASLAGGGEVGSGYAASAPASDGSVFGGVGSGGGAGGVAGNTSTGSSTMFDDYGNPLDMGGSTTAPNTGDPNATGAFDQSGSQGVFDAQGNPIYQQPAMSTADMMKQAQDLAAKFGITPASALKYLASAVGRGAPAALGAVAANRQANDLQALNQQYMAMGAPSRARYEASFDPNFTMMNDPGYADALAAASKASLHGLSVTGNPAGSPNAWAQTLSDVNSKFAYPALTQYRNQNAATGGIAAFNAAAPGTALGTIDARGNVLNAVGAGVNDIFNPRPSLADILAAYGKAA